MGFTDREIVALSGAHTMGRCHAVRSGFDGPWTTHPLRFDNEYYVNLMERKWTEKKWTGPRQFEDETKKLMMLPTDIALIQDTEFKKFVVIFAKDQNVWFTDFANAFGKLLALGCPASCDPSRSEKQVETKDTKKDGSAEFRELAMHGSVGPAQELVRGGQADPHQLESTSGRSALHKAAFWGHTAMTTYLVTEVKIDLNVQDVYGDTAMHDAAKFGHDGVVRILVTAGANIKLKNKAGMDPLMMAKHHDKPKVVAILEQGPGPVEAKTEEEGKAEGKTKSKSAKKKGKKGKKAAN